MRRNTWKARGPRPHVRRPYRPALEQLEARQLLSFTPTSVLTYHNDLGRTGQNLTESILAPGNVATGSFGKLFSYHVDGQVYAQPLYVPGVQLPDGSVHDIVYIATEHDSVYAFDADNPDPGSGGGLLWQDSFIDPSRGIMPFTQADALNCGQITPEIGITDTPVIDPDTGVMYLVAQTREAGLAGVTYHQTIHALDITTGADVVDPVEVQASVVNDSGRTVTFNPRYYKERAALTLINGTLYTAWASHCDITPSNGWVIGYTEDLQTQVSVFNTSPNGSLDTIWQGNGGLASDGLALYFETGNGTDITRFGDDYSEAFLRLNLADGQTVDDYFIPSNFADLDRLDRDIGSGAPIVLPDQPGDHPHLLVGGGKDGRIFVMDRDNMGRLNNPPNGPDLVVQTVPNALSGGSWDTPVYFDAGDPNGPYIYYVGNGDFAKAFQLTNGLLTLSPTSQSPTRFSGNYGATPIVSANGTQNGILWALENRSGNATLHAYDATDLSNELYNSNQVSSDRMGSGVKFNSPIVADGKVFVPTANSVEIFGLLGGRPGPGHLGVRVAHHALNAHSQAAVLTPAVVAPLADDAGRVTVRNAAVPALPYEVDGPAAPSLAQLTAADGLAVTGGGVSQAPAPAPVIGERAPDAGVATLVDATLSLGLDGRTA